MKDYTCRRLRLYTYLEENGFHYKFKRLDFKNDKFVVWVYEDTEDLHKVIERYYAQVPRT